MEALRTIQSIEKMSKLYNDFTTIDPMTILEPFKKLTWTHLTSIGLLILFIKDPFGMIYFLLNVLYWVVIISRNITFFTLEILIELTQKLFIHIQKKWHSSELKNLLVKVDTKTENFVRMQGNIVNEKEFNTENEIKNLAIMVSAEKTEFTESQINPMIGKIGKNKYLFLT